MKYINVLHADQQAIVDDDDYEWVSGISWRAHHGYARARVKGKGKFMHRLINQTPDGFVTDHINGNKLDNRKCNLRTVTIGENKHWSDKYSNKQNGRLRGATPYRDGKWVAQITINGKVRYLGIFSSEEEAATAYDMAAKAQYGEFAKTNF